MSGRGLAHCEARAQHVSKLLPPRSAAAHARRALLTERRPSLGLWPCGASFILPDDDCVPFLQISDDYLGYTAVGEACANQSGFDLLVRGQHPNCLPLSSRTAASEGLTTLPLALTLTSSRRTCFAAAGRLTLSAQSLTFTPSPAAFTVAVVWAFATLTHATVAVIRIPLTTSPEALAVAVAFAAFGSPTPALAVAVTLAAFGPLPPRFPVALKAFASFPRTFRAVRATRTAFIVGTYFPARSFWLLTLLILRGADFLTLLAALSLAFGVELFSALVNLHPKRLLFLIRQGGLESKRGIGHG
jgi:hypothetical protein